MTAPQPVVFLGFPQLHASYGAGKSVPAFRLFIWRGIKRGTFPAPKMLSDRVRVWVAAEIEAWAAALPVPRYAARPEASPTRAATKTSKKTVNPSSARG